jgi:hypothetical protein
VVEDSADRVLLAHEGKDAHALAAAGADERVGCHQSGGASGPNLFRTTIPREKFETDVATGIANTLMPSFGSLLSKEEIEAIYAVCVGWLICQSLAGVRERRAFLLTGGRKRPLRRPIVSANRAMSAPLAHGQPPSFT